MTDRIEVGIGTDGASELDGLTSAIGKLITAVDKLGNMGSSFDALQRAMAGMHATMETGFREMETLAKGSGQRTAKIIEENGNVSASAMKAAGEKLLKADAATWRQVQAVGSSNVAKAFSEMVQGIPVEAIKLRYGELATEHAAFLSGDINKLREYNETVTHLNVINSEKQKQNAIAARADQYAKESAMMQEALNMNEAFDSKRVAAAQAAQEKLGSHLASFYSKQMAMMQEAYKMNEAFDAKRVASELATQEKLGASLASYYSKEAAMRHEAQTMNEAFDAKKLASAEALIEKQRALNTSFLTSSPAAQLHTVTQAQTYSSLGGDASAKYGSSAAAITEDSAAYLKLKSSTESSTHAILTHNAAMAEGHAFARGLSGALGTLWVTYGSIIPLLAGAAIAGSLKNIVEVGKEVEYQLKFVEALGGGTVNLDEFLKISEGTVVSVKAAGEGMRALAQNGLDAQQSLKAMPDILNLATIGEMNVGEAALAATGVVAAFNLELSDIGRVGDIFAKAAATSNTSVALMAESMKTASTAAGLYHVSIEETAASLGVLAKLNITGTAAGTSFRNVLKDLYTPTKKQAEGLDALGISTREASGELKSYTDIMTQVRDKTAGLSESGKLNFLSQISDERGAKTLAAVLGNWDSFIQKMDEASKAAGFNAAAVAKLEDSVEGSTRRAANAVSSTLMRAFQETSPAIEKLMLDLGDLAKSQGAIDTLVALGSAVLRLTQFILDHSTAIAELIAVYIGLRVVGSVVASYQGLALALGTSTIAATAKTVVTDLLAKAEGMVFVKTAAATGAIEAEAVAAASSVAPVAALTGAIEAEAAAAAASVAPITEATVVTFSLAGAVRVLMAAFGFITIAITLAVTAYELFFKTTSAGDKITQQTDNTNKLLNETLDKQIEKLKEINGLRMVDGPKANMQSLVGAREALVAKNPIATMSSDTLREIHDLDDKIEAERLKSIEIERKQTEEADLTRMATTRQTHKDTLTNLQKFYAERNALNSDGLKKKASGQAVGDSDYLHSVAQRAVYAQAGAVQTDLNLHPENVAIATQKLTELKTALSKVSEGYEAAKEDTKAENDAFKAQMQILQNLIDLRKQAAGFKIDDIHASVKAGTTGKVEGAMQEYDTKTAAAEDELSVMQQQLALAATMDDRRALSAKIEGTIHKQQMDDLQNKRVMEQTIEAERLSGAEKVTKAAAEQAAADHNYAMAAAIQWEADNARVKSGLQRDLAAAEARKQIADNMGMMGLPSISDEDYAKSLGIIADLEAQLDGLEKERKIKIDAGSIKEATENLDISFRNAATSLTELQTKAANVTGLEDGLQVNAAAESLQNKLIPELEQAVLAAKALNPSMDTSKFDESIAKMKKSMNSLAQSPMALMFKQMSKDLAGMGTGFDRASKAMSGLSNTFANLSKIQKDATLSDEQRTIQTISQYGQIADSAKGFFAEGSDGYKAMDIAAKALNVTAAITAVLTQASGDPYTAFARMAAMIVAVASLGVSISSSLSGPSDTTAADRQKAAGAGSVLGDTTAKSDSIAKSLELLGQVQSVALKHTISMDDSLKSMVGNIGGLTRVLVQSGYAGEIKNSESASIYAGGAAHSAQMQKIFNPAYNGLDPAVALFGKKIDPLGSLLGKIVGAIFGGKVTTTDYGISGGKQSLGQVGASGVVANKYADITTAGGWFHKDKKSTLTETLGADANSQLTQVVMGLADAVKFGASALGVSGDAFNTKLNSFVVDLSNISTKGMTTDQIQKQFEAIFSKMGDDMASFAIDGLGPLAKVGEGALQTLARVSQNLLTANGMLKDLGQGLFEVSLKGADAASQLVDLFGGIANMTSAGSDYFDKYFTDAERVQKQTAAMGTQFTALGRTMPTTLAGMRKMIEDAGTAESLATDAGRRLYAGLMQLAGGFADLQTAVGAANTSAADKSTADAKTQTDAVGKAYATLERSVQAEKDTETMRYNAAKASVQAAITTAESAATVAKSNATAFGSALAAMKITSVALQAQERRYAQAVIMQALASGSTSITPELQTAMSTVAQPSENLFSSFEDYARDFYHTSNNIAGLKATADTQAAAAQAQVDSLKAQLSSLDLFHSLNLAKLDAQLEEAKTQVDLLNGIDSSVLDVSTAISQLNGALGTAGVAPVQKRDQSLMAGDAQAFFDQNAIGTTIKWASGILTKLTETTADYFGTAGKHVTLTNSSSDFSAEALSDPDVYKAWYKQYGFAPKIPGYATGGNHSGGLRMVGEAGMEIENTGPSHITNANDTAELMGAAPEEMRKVAVILAGMRDDARAAAFETIKTLKKQLNILEEEKATGKWVRGSDATTPINVKVIP